MDFGSIFISLAIVIVVVGYVARPLLERRSFSVPEGSRHISELQAERDQIIMILQELDMDHAMGKIPVEDYQSQRPGLVARGAAILKELDQLKGVKSTRSVIPGKTNGHEEPDLGAQIEAEILRRRKTTNEGSGGYCTNCGNKLHTGDLFCTSCGGMVELTEAET